MQEAEFVISPSKRLFYFLHVIYILALFVIATLQLTLLWKIVGISILIWSFHQDILSYTLFGCTKRANNKTIRFWHEKGKIFRIDTAKGPSLKGILKGDSYKCSWFIILRIKVLSRTNTIFVAKDSVTELEYRILCQRLISH